MENFAKAMNALQAEMPVIGKNAKGYGYEYADLPKVIEVLFPLMTKHGFSVTQMLGESSNGDPALLTSIFHNSGEYIGGSYPLVKAGISKANDAQQFGAAVTYARRYALLAAFGVPVADDDAACLTEKPKAKKPAKKEESRQENFTKELETITTMDDLKKTAGAYKANAKATGWLDTLTDSYNAKKDELEQEAKA